MSGEATMDHVSTLPFTEQIRQIVLNDASSIEAVRSGEMAGWETALGRMYLQWSGLQIVNGEPILHDDTTLMTTGNEITVGKISSVSIPEVSANISPANLVRTFAHPLPTLMRYMQTMPEVDGDMLVPMVGKQITESKHILLAGAIIPGSVQSLMQELSEFGFKGSIDVVDISPLSIQLLEVFKPYLENTYTGITLNLIQADLSHVTVDRTLSQTQIVHGSLGGSIHIPENYWDMEIFDVIGTYVSDKNIEELAQLLEGLTDSGISFIRDLAEFPVEIINNTRLVDPADQIKRLDEFKQWLANSFDLDIPDIDIASVANNIFTKNATHTERKEQLLQLWAHAISNTRPEHMILQYFNFYPKGGNPNERYFLNMLVGRRI